MVLWAALLFKDNKKIVRNRYVNKYVEQNYF